MSEIQPHKWVLPIHQIPSQPSGFRVEVWHSEPLAALRRCEKLLQAPQSAPEGIEKSARALGSRLVDAKLLEVGMHLFDGLLEIVEEEGIP